METLGVGNPLPWPELFDVTILDRGGNTYSYEVVSWLSEQKAIALAVGRHADRFPSADDMRGKIYDVAIRTVGPCPKHEDGTVSLGEALFDRTEF